MKSSWKILAVVLVAFALSACNQSNEEKMLAAASKNKDVNPSRQAMPKCEERDKDGHYIVPGGCTKADWAAWRAAGN